MYIPWIDILVVAAAAWGARVGRRRGLGREMWRIFRRLFPALFGFGLYRAMAAMLVKLPGLREGPARFWGFVIIFAAVMALMHKGRSRFRDGFIAWGNRRPASWGAVAGCLRSLLTSGLVVFVLSMFPLGYVRQTVESGSWLVRFLP